MKKKVNLALMALTCLSICAFNTSSNIELKQENIITSEIINNDKLLVKALNSGVDAEGLNYQSFTYEVLPSTAFNKKVKAELSWVDTTNSEDISTKLKVGIDQSTSTITITKLLDFSKQAKLIITSLDNPKITSNVLIDNAKKIYSCDFNHSYNFNQVNQDDPMNKGFSGFDFMPPSTGSSTLPEKNLTFNDMHSKLLIDDGHFVFNEHSIDNIGVPSLKSLTYKGFDTDCHRYFAVKGSRPSYQYFDLSLEYSKVGLSSEFSQNFYSTLDNDFVNGTKGIKTCLIDLFNITSEQDKLALREIPSLAFSIDYYMDAEISYSLSDRIDVLHGLYTCEFEIYLSKYSHALGVVETVNSEVNNIIF